MHLKDLVASCWLNRITIERQVKSLHSARLRALDAFALYLCLWCFSFTAGVARDAMHVNLLK